MEPSSVKSPEYFDQGKNIMPGLKTQILTQDSDEKSRLNQKERKIILIDLLNTEPIRERQIQFSKLVFTVREYRIGRDFSVAEDLIRTFDGYADAFAIAGVPKHMGVEEKQMTHPGYLKLLRAATKTPLYAADDLREFFSEWTLKKVLKEQPQLFTRKKVLFQCATASSILPQVAAEASNIYAADSLLLTGSPILLNGMKSIRRFFDVIRPIFGSILFQTKTPNILSKRAASSPHFGKWMKNIDIFVGFGNMICRFEDLTIFKDKIIILDHADQNTKNRLMNAGVAQIIEFIPEGATKQITSFEQFPTLAAIIDLSRQEEAPHMDFEDYLLQWIERNQVSPKALKSNKGIVRRVAFVIHALSQNDLFKIPHTKFIQQSPPFVRGLFEKAVGRLPCFYMGQLTGVKSEFNGQEAICDFYGLAATPRGILQMKEECLYQRLVDCAELARKNGAGMIGLGAYTKVAGDAGVTVARRASIPVTNGNSYSASTTLWAARQMVERLGMVPPEKQGSRLKAKAMVIGATGSIGRVSSLLLSLVTQEIVLVATRADKLLELREEIHRLSPEVQVRLTTHADREISDVDLIVTATSNQKGKVLDMEKVKPGAVVCDCSRPLDIGIEEAKKRPDVLVIESGEVILPGSPKLNIDIGLPHPTVYACTAETVLLALEGRYESFSLSKQLSLEKTKEIYRIGEKHGAKLSAIQGPLGIITDEMLRNCKQEALKRLKSWKIGAA